MNTNGFTFKEIQMKIYNIKYNVMYGACIFDRNKNLVEKFTPFK